MNIPHEPHDQLTTPTTDEAISSQSHLIRSSDALRLSQPDATWSRGRATPDAIPPPLSALSTVPSQCSPHRALRRKKRMTLLKRKSSISLRSRVRTPSPFLSRVETATPCSDPARSSYMLSLASSMGIDPPARLGHPSRPYYTAIRQNMSRPTTPCLPRTPSPVSPEFDYMPRGTRSLDCGERLSMEFGCQSRPMSMVLPGHITSASPFSGFSLSGETEMRMALAKWRHEDAPDVPGDYHFHDMGQRGKVGVKGKVKKLGQGLKELVLGRTC
ncbi:hypothetical protein BV22DRAFT_232536 [Leucogyrophana mollusca]|uniref:Uncharacterized protein n=1 Tax=Leucogyrophana mollusca TaxID=85980 RepID=A0ACB8BRU6_9AGAM|nr:hypothetical protein BV22DRAFT_232536 [Leucogyrophana mollusca]